MREIEITIFNKQLSSLQHHLRQMNSATRSHVVSRLVVLNLLTIVWYWLNLLTCPPYQASKTHFHVRYQHRCPWRRDERGITSLRHGRSHYFSDFPFKKIKIVHTPSLFEKTLSPAL